jgi:hypothetical protein
MVPEQWRVKVKEGTPKSFPELLKNLQLSECSTNPKQDK